MLDKPTLRSAVFTKYRSINEFSKVIGWSYAKAYRIVNGTQLPDINDVREINKALGVTDAGEVIGLFSLL